MNSQFRSRQSGISFIGLLFVAIVLGSLALVGMKVFPTFLENQSIEKAINRSTGEGSTVTDIRRSFDRAAEVDQISSIKGSDLEISKEGDKIVVAYAYEREIELFGPVFLLIKYSGRSK